MDRQASSLSGASSCIVYCYCQLPPVRYDLLNHSSNCHSVSDIGNNARCVYPFLLQFGDNRCSGITVNVHDSNCSSHFAKCMRKSSSDPLPSSSDKSGFAIERNILQNRLLDKNSVVHLRNSPSNQRVGNQLLPASSWPFESFNALLDLLSSPSVSLTGLYFSFSVFLISAVRSRISSLLMPATSYMAKMFSSGVSGGTASEAARMKPPPPAVMPSISCAVALDTSLTLPKGRTLWVSSPPHKNTSRSPNARFSSSQSVRGSQPERIGASIRFPKIGYDGT